jgi:hypothetical protein
MWLCFHHRMFVSSIFHPTIRGAWSLMSHYHWNFTHGLLEYSRSTMKMEVAGSSETLVPIYMRCHTPRNGTSHVQLYENLKPRITNVCGELDLRREEKSANLFFEDSSLLGCYSVYFGKQYQHVEGM